MISNCCDNAIAAKGGMQLSLCSTKVKANIHASLQDNALVTLCTLPTTPALLDAVSVLGTLNMQCHCILLAPFGLPALQQRCAADA